MSNTTPTILLGIDPGFDRMGWAIGAVSSGAALTLQNYGAIETTKYEDIFSRYEQLQEELQTIIATYKPQETAIESLFFFNNQKTAMRVSEARGLIISNVLAAQSSVFEYTPLQIKHAITGYGKAEKAAVDKMVRLQLHLPESKILDDTMDALAILLTHSTARTLRKLI